MVAAAADLLCAGVLDHWSASELAADDHEGLVEHAAVFEILDKRRDGAVGSLGVGLLGS